MSVLIHTGYVLLLILLTAYVLWSPRKEVPIFVMLHTLVQYGFTLGIWFFTLRPSTTGWLLLGLWTGTPLMIWGRMLQVGGRLTRTYRTAAILGWVLFVAVAGWMTWMGPFEYQEVGAAWRDIFPGTPLLLNQVFKWAGNGLIFLTLFQIILQWGQPWTPAQTWLSFGPMVLYLFVLIILQVHLSTLEQAPFI